MSYQICTKTVMDTSDPSIKFDAQGVSNHYLEFKKNVEQRWKSLTWQAKGEKAFVREVRKNALNQEYDCLLGISGGLDSSYMLHLAVTKFKLKPLVFHVDGGWNTDIAVNNINNLVNRLNVDLYTEVINWDEMRNFQLALFRAGVPYLDAPQDIAFAGVLYKFARNHGIKTVLNGGNIATESVRYPYQYYYLADKRLFYDIIKKHASGPLKTYPFTSVFYRKIVAPYFFGISTHKVLNNVSYNQSSATELLKTQYGWNPYPQKHFESRFTKFFEGYWLPTRFNFDVRRVQYSSLILSGQMSRSEALEKLKSPAIPENEIGNELSYVAKKLKITTAELLEYHQMPKKYYWDYANNNVFFNSAEKFVAPALNIRRGGAY